MKRLALTAALVLTATAAQAQSTKYYINDGDANTGFILQGGILTSTYTLDPVNGYPMYPLLFTGSDFVVANRSGSAAVQYDANGTPTGTTYSNGGQSVDQLLDGGTDGTHSYAARCCSGANGIYAGDLQFGNMTQISSLGSTGVTFASSVGDLFALDFSGNLYQMTTGGTLLNTFSTGITNAAALAFESSTNTLWFAQNQTGNIYQYDLSGNQVQTFLVPQMVDYNYWGGEMPESVVPEPSSMALLATGLPVLVGFARRRRKHLGAAVV